MELLLRFLMDFPLPLPLRLPDALQGLWEAAAEAEVSDAPNLIKRCAARSGHQGPVLAVLAMLAAKRRLRVAPRGCALPSTAVARGALCECRPGRRNGAPTELRNMAVEEDGSGTIVVRLTLRAKQRYADDTAPPMDERSPKSGKKACVSR